MVKGSQKGLYLLTLLRVYVGNTHLYLAWFVQDHKSAQVQELELRDSWPLVLHTRQGGLPVSSFLSEMLVSNGMNPDLGIL